MNEKEEKTRRVLVYVVTIQVVLQSCGVRHMEFTMIAGEYRSMLLLKRLSQSIASGKVHHIKQALRELSIRLWWFHFHKLLENLRNVKLSKHNYFWKDYRTTETNTFTKMLMHVKTDLALNKQRILKY